MAQCSFRERPFNLKKHNLMSVAKFYRKKKLLCSFQEQFLVELKIKY